MMNVYFSLLHWMECYQLGQNVYLKGNRDL